MFGWLDKLHGTYKETKVDQKSSVKPKEKQKPNNGTSGVNKKQKSK